MAAVTICSDFGPGAAEWARGRQLLLVTVWDERVDSTRAGCTTPRALLPGAGELGGLCECQPRINSQHEGSYDASVAIPKTAPGPKFNSAGGLKSL